MGEIIMDKQRKIRSNVLYRIVTALTENNVLIRDVDGIFAEAKSILVSQPVSISEVSIFLNFPYRDKPEQKAEN
jgi:hypothetical protein